MLFGAGMGVPENMEPRVERRYFSRLHYLALVCDDERLAARLRARPQWRASRDEAFIESQIQFNRWHKNHGPEADPPIQLLDTTELSVQDAARQITWWLSDGLESKAENFA
jgi:hypothetical protein